MRVLVTGGAGYVGSHVAWRLCEEGHQVTILDNLARGHRGALRGAPLIQADLRDRAAVSLALRETRPEVVLHFAGLAIVPESVSSPGEYYDVNMTGGLALLSACHESGVRGFVFSSTCAVYGVPRQVPIAEGHPVDPASPYGRTKLAFEFALGDAARAWGIGAVALRYFNAAGAAPEAGLGEDHRPETHLVPTCLMAALGRAPEVPVHGEDYPTPDGTCIRDYVHVMDLADAHVRAMSGLDPGKLGVYNLGTGKGTSVREVLDAVRRVTGRPVPSRAADRRPGDPPVLVAARLRAERDLGWVPRQSGIEEVVESAWRWRSERPEGY